MAGVYANFANVTFSAYEFTITFARIDHEIEEGDVPGVVVSRVNMSQQFFPELLARCRTPTRSGRPRKGSGTFPKRRQEASRNSSARFRGCGGLDGRASEARTASMRRRQAAPWRDN